MTRRAARPSSTALFRVAYPDRGKLSHVHVLARGEEEAKAKALARGVSPGRVERAFGLFRVSQVELLFFTRELAAFVRSGVAVSRALIFLERQASSGFFRAVIWEVASMVQRGIAFSEAIARFPEVFPPLYVAVVKAGESAGTLDRALANLAGYIARERRFMGKLRSAIAYPVFVLVASLLVVYFLVVGIVPRFAELSKGFGIELPFLTRLMVDLASFMGSPPFLLLLVLGGGGAFFAFSRLEEVRDRLQRRLLSLRVVGELYVYMEVGRFAQGMALLLGSGVSVLEALRLMRPVFGFTVFRRAVDSAHELVKVGLSLSQALGRSLVWPKILLALVAVGEETGSVDRMLEDFAGYANERFEELGEMVTAFVQPLLTVAVGGVVLFILLAVLLPYANIVQQIQNLR